MNNRIYISGPITGVDGWEKKFKKAEDMVTEKGFFDRNGSAELYYKSRMFGFEAVSPRVFNGGVRYKKRWWYMVRSLYKMTSCTYVYMMMGWNYSRGSRIEHTFAGILGKRIIYEEDMYGSCRMD